MKGIVFAAGVGSRLKPFTDRHPKALATINGKALLGYAIENLVSAGTDGIIINIHHFPEQIIKYIDENYSNLEIELSDESDLLLETGGALAKIGRESKILSKADDSEPVIVTNADVITDLSFQDMVDYHSHNPSFSTILVNPDRESSRKILFDCHRLMRGWHDYKKDISRPADIRLEDYDAAAFCCVHIMNAASIRTIASGQGPSIRPFGIMDYYIENCRDFDIKAYVPKNPYRWHDIGTYDKLEAARQDFS